MPRAATAIPLSNPPPPTGTTMASASGSILHDLQAHGALSGDDVGIVERGDHGAALFAGQRGGMLVGVVVRLAVQDDLGSVPAGRLGLGARGGGGHHHQRGNAGPGGGHGDTLGMVARAGGDDSTRPLLGGEVGDLEPRAAQLERARVLE